MGGCDSWSRFEILIFIFKRQYNQRAFDSARAGGESRPNDELAAALHSGDRRGDRLGSFEKNEIKNYGHT